MYGQGKLTKGNNSVNKGKVTLFFYSAIGHPKLNLCVKFEVSTLKNMGGSKIWYGQGKLTKGNNSVNKGRVTLFFCPAIGHPKLNLRVKFEVSTLKNMEDMVRTSKSLRTTPYHYTSRHSTGV